MLNKLFKSIIDQDNAPIVICNLDSIIVCMNPAAVARYHGNLTGTDIHSYHNEESNAKINKVVAWFALSKENNTVYTSRNDKENKDVYMVALRDGDGTLIGYYEKHVYRNAETSPLYSM